LRYLFHFPNVVGISATVNATAQRFVVDFNHSFLQALIMDNLIPIVCAFGAVALFILAFFTYKKPNKTYPTLPVTSKQNKSETMFWSRFLNFDEFITTQILKAVYVIGTAVIIIALVAGIIMHTTWESRESRSMTEITQGIFATFVIALFSLLLWRVFCELVMVIFKINENLQAFRDKKQIVDTKHIID
jgi:hypothetical protein